MEYFDQDKDNSISYREFQAFVRPKTSTERTAVALRRLGCNAGFIHACVVRTQRGRSHRDGSAEDGVGVGVVGGGGGNPRPVLDAGAARLVGK